MDMEEKEIIEIENVDGSVETVDVVTYLVSDDNLRNYVVYTKGEKQGIEEDRVIYISRISKESEVLKLEEIVDDEEWNNVQYLLKKIANAR